MNSPLSPGQASPLLPSRGQEEPVDLLDRILVPVTSSLIPLIEHQEGRIPFFFPFLSNIYSLLRFPTHFQTHSHFLVVFPASLC